MLKRDLPSRAYSLLGGYANMQVTTNVESKMEAMRKKKLGRGRELLTRKDQKRFHDDVCGI